MPIPNHQGRLSGETLCLWCATYGSSRCDGVDPITGQPAVWIHADGREVAELAGCRILEASAALAGHFGEIVLGHAD